MAGLVGIFRPGGLTAADRLTVQRLAQGLDYTGVSDVDTWSDASLCVARVHHPDEATEPPAQRADLDAALIYDGSMAEEPSGGRSPAAWCLDLYADHGSAGLAQVNGQFNVILSDRRRRALLLVNDRFASRPLYYHATAERVIWSNQVRGLLAPDVPRRLCEAGMHQVFVFQTILDERTLLEDVRTLPPAGVLTFQDGRAAVARYWELRYREASPRSPRHDAEELAETLRGAVRRNLRSAKRAGLLLSGGLDSRAIIACSPVSLAAVTIADSENAEVEVARRLAATRDLSFTFVRRDPDYYAGLVDLGAALGDGASRFDNAHFGRLREALGGSVSGLATGYGFDLLLKGAALPKRRLHLLGWPLNRHRLVDPGVRASRAALVDVVLDTQGDCLWHHPVLPRLFRRPELARLEETVRGVVDGILARAEACAPDPVRRCEFVRMNMLATRFNAFLNVLSIRHFYRDYTVAFDNAVLDRHLDLPSSLRLDGIVYKRALHLLDPAIASVADANTGLPPRTHYLVEHARMRARLAASRVTRRPVDLTASQGSWPRMDELIRQRPALAGRLADVIGDDAALPGDLLDIPGLKAVLAEHLAGRADATWPLLLTLSFGTWYRHTVTGEAG
jgi:asparagine synthase (glutamine-hydrolysing)